MSVPVHDPTLLAQLLAAEDVVELTDPDGRVLGTFAADGLADLTTGRRVSGH